MDIAALLSSAFIRVKLVTCVHFVLTANALLGTYLPASYMFYNLLFFIALFWTIHCKESVDAIFTAALIDACSIALDLICIILFFTHYNNAWSIIFSIVNLVARPFSLYLLHKEMVERGGTFSISSVYPSNTQRSYEDIDRPTQSVPTNNVPPSQQPPPNISNIF